MFVPAATPVVEAITNPPGGAPAPLAATTRPETPTGTFSSTPATSAAFLKLKFRPGPTMLLIVPYPRDAEVTT